MPIGISPERADVVETGGVQGVVAVGNIAVELKVGTSRLTGRQLLVVYNDSSTTIFTGPSQSISAMGTNKGIPLFKDQERVIPVGDRPFYAISASGTASILVQELS